MYLSIVKVLAKMRREDGQDLVEYALILLLVAIAAVTAVSTFGSELAALYLTMPGLLFGG